jgi:hypothetical protein
MMPVEKAKRLAEQHFPSGHEKLAESLGITVKGGPLAGCDGWVLSGPGGILIRLNAAASPTRRRFTLAHELGHLLLGIPTVIGESVYDSLKSDSAEERKVNDLASELLLPQSIVRQFVPAVPVVAKQLSKLAKQAKVSDLMAAIRVANLAEELGLENASVAFFQDGKLAWNWSRTLTMRQATAEHLLEAAQESQPQAARIERKTTNDVIVASLIDNPYFNSATLFVQLLPAGVGNQLAPPERRQQLEAFLFGDDDEFRMSLQGVFGAFRPKCTDWTLDEAVSEFYRAKSDRWDGVRRTRLLSAKGREYVRLRLQEWCRE